MTKNDFSYPDTQLYIDGVWREGTSGKWLEVINPALGEVVGKVAHASVPDLDEALEAADRGFATWRKVPAFERYQIMRRAADILKEREDHIARILTCEQGKPLAEARLEVRMASQTVEWLAEEGRRLYGRIVPARQAGVVQSVLKQPVGPVAAFTPWNFPINQVVRKLSAALATGCSILIKGPEETPASPAELVRAFADAGVPAGVIGLVYGNPAEISGYVVPHPVIQKISFTGSTAVGKHLAALAGQHMKRATMELGGHAPALVFDDADLKASVAILKAAKFRNAGQVCVAPTRFLVQDGIYDEFLDSFTTAAKAIAVGNGMDEGTQMGPLANDRRVSAMEELIGDAVSRGARLATGGERIGNRGYFFEPTILAEVPRETRIMNEEPFGPVALVNRFSSRQEAIAEANRLPFGLAGYAFTASAATAHALSEELELGILTLNHNGIGLPEVPFGGVQDSGYGSEGGIEALEPYVVTKLFSHRMA